MRDWRSLASRTLFVILAVACAGPGPSSVTRRNLAALEAADLALARGDVEEATRAYDAILSESPHLAPALLGGARAAFAAGDGETAVSRFATYRADGEPWQKVEEWEYCAALTLGTEQRLANPDAASGALEWAEQLRKEGCQPESSRRLWLRSRLAVADGWVRNGHVEQALAEYLAVVDASESGSGAEVPAKNRGKLGSPRVESPRERAYLAAAKLLSESGRREEALALLSRGLDEFPANRDLVHRMVTLLADGSSVVFPRAKPPEPSRPAATQ